MARVNYVKHARQRYEMVPVTDEQGNPVRTAVTRRNGEQRTTKHGKAITRAQSRQDRSKPLPNLRCERCSQEILPGDPYKWVKPKSGPYGGRMRVRCAHCPTWQPWDLSSSLSAQLARISHDANGQVDGIENEDEAREILEQAAGEIRDLASEKAEGADNIESGFGHEVEASINLRDTAEQLESWADDVEAADVPDLPEPEEDDCPDCNGAGYIEGPTAQDECDLCAGSGLYTPDDPTEEQMDDWREQVREALTILDESPV